MTVAFGPDLKEWRARRRLSHLDLALEAGVSARHVSFMETGRARPSRGMVLRLCEVLHVPRPARNQLLTAAGHAPAYAARPDDAPDLAPLNAAIDRMLDTHDPFPAIVLDRSWEVVRLNSAAARLFGAVGIGVGDNVLAAFISGDQLEFVENVDEVVAHMVTRLKTELAHFGADPLREAAIAALTALVPDAAEPPALTHPALVPIRYRTPIGTLSLFSVFAQFGSVEDIAYGELQIEMMHPADDASRAILEAMAG